ncbi:hypothetical protein ACIRG5_19930 [Lentzea sp. NPDC102401]|uniref:hypothetical protein n=1 Tax=Lentzea sp. NPDC102401 TaxID=3364128 RepID=UPI00381C1930
MTMVVSATALRGTTRVRRLVGTGGVSLVIVDSVSMIEPRRNTAATGRLRGPGSEAADLAT